MRESVSLTWLTNILALFEKADIVMWSKRKKYMEKPLDQLLFYHACVDIAVHINNTRPFKLFYENSGFREFFLRTYSIYLLVFLLNT